MIIRIPFVASEAPKYNPLYQQSFPSQPQLPYTYPTTPYHTTQCDSSKSTAHTAQIREKSTKNEE